MMAMDPYRSTGGQVLRAGGAGGGREGHTAAFRWRIRI